MPASNTLGNVQMSWFDDIRLGDHPLETDLLDPNTGEVLETLNGGDRTVGDGAEPDSPLETIAQVAEPGMVRGAVLPTNAFCAPCASCTYIDSMISGFISFPGDVDWYKLPAVRAGSRITADLTNLPLDADLVLYGPSGISSSPSVFPNAQSRNTTASSARALKRAAAGRSPCRRAYSIRILPQPGQSMPNNSLVGHVGIGPPGVVGSAIQTAQQPHAASAATPAGAHRRCRTDVCRSRHCDINTPTILRSPALSRRRQ